MKKLSKALAALLALCLVASFFPAAFAIQDNTYHAEDEPKTFDGDVTGTDVHELVKADAYYDDASVTVNGNVSDTGGTGSLFAVSVQSDEYTASGTVNGSVLCESEGGAEGVYVYAGYEGTGGTASLEVTGDVNAVSEGGTAMNYIAAYKGTANLTVGGDVSATSTDGDGYGLSMYTKSNGKIDALVEGTLSGSTAAVRVKVGGNSGVDRISLTVWEAETNADDEVVLGSSGNAGYRELEQNILYIIKMDEAAQGQVTLEGTTDSHGFDCAREGETVTLTGANLGSLICDGTTLEKDGNDNYYLVVPKGGGVKLRYQVKVVAVAEAAPVVDENIIEVLTTGEGIGLRLLRDGTYVLRLADGMKFYGAYELVDGVPVFTLADGSTVTAELDENGNYVFTLPYGEGQTTTFTISPNKLAILTAALA